MNDLNNNEISKWEKMTKVLIAHKAVDRDTAFNLKTELEVYASDRLECVFLQENSNQSGWETDLRSMIDETDLLLFVVSDCSIDNNDLGWFIWVASASYNMAPGGQFPRLIMHNENVIPHPILSPYFTNFVVKEEKLIEFLKYSFGSPDFTQDKKH